MAAKIKALKVWIIFGVAVFILAFRAKPSLCVPLKDEHLTVKDFKRVEFYEITEKRTPFEVKTGLTVSKQPQKVSLASFKNKAVPRTETDMFELQEGLFYDSYGVPWVDYKYISGIYIGLQRNPVTISQTSLKWLNLFNQTKETIYFNYSFNCVQWLIDFSKPFNDGLILTYTFPYPPYNLKPEWYSGMAQGQAVQSMVAAYRHTKNRIYLDTAKKLLKPLWVEVKNGGVMVKVASDAYWYEEYASKYSEPPMVLNGMNFCLFGIYDYYCETQDPEARTLFEYGVNAVKLLLDRFDCNGWSYYDLKQKKASYYYHSIHINQMQKLYDITGEEVFRYYHDRWLASLNATLK